MTRSLALLVLVSLPAFAEYELYGFGPRAAAMGGAMTAEVNDYTAAFYNPAQMAGRELLNVGVSFQYLGMISQVSSLDPAREVRCTNCVAPPVAGTTFGAVFPLIGFLKDRVALGLGVYLPGGVLVGLDTPDRETPYWLRYQSSAEKLQLHMALAVKIMNWLKVGVGLQVLAYIEGKTANVNVNLFAPRVLAVDIDAVLGARAAPVFALFSQPIPRLRLGATFRWAMQIDYRIPATVEVTNLGTLGVILEGVTQFTPHTLQLGVAFDVTENFTLSLDGQWMHWSQTPSPYMGVVLEVDSDTLEALGMQGVTDVPSRQPAGFSDAFGGRLGAELRVHDRVALRAGSFVRQSPVPSQDAPRTNLMDNTTVGASLGLGLNFFDPWGLLEHPIFFDVAGQGQFVLERTANKNEADVTPSYSYAAQVLGVTVALRYDF